MMDPMQPDREKKSEHLADLLPPYFRRVFGEVPIQKFTHNSKRNKSKDPAHHTSRFGSQAPASRIVVFEPNTC